MPFYVMQTVHGHVLSEGAPEAFWAACQARPMMNEFVAGMAEIWRTAIGIESLYQRMLRGKGDVASVGAFEREVPLQASRAAEVLNGSFL